MLTPLDISGKEFSRSLNGYSRSEVDDFLEKVSEHFEAIMREADFLKKQIVDVEKKLIDFQTQETSLKDALLVAQITATDMKKKAEIEAERIIKQAEGESQNILKEATETAESVLARAKQDADKNLDQAKSDYKDILHATSDLKRDYLDFKEKYQHVLREQINVLDRLVVKDELTD